MSKKKSTPNLIKIWDGQTVKDVNGDTVNYHPIYKTDDYEKIETHQLNRPIKPKHLESLGKSIYNNGVLGVIAVVAFLKGRFIFVDGHHRAKFCYDNGLPITFSLRSVKDEKDMFNLMAELNNSGESWSMKTYVEGWAYFHDSYKEILRLKEQYNLTYTILATLLSGMSIHHTKQALKKGEIISISKNRAMKYIARINKLYRVMNEQLINYSYTTEGLIRLINFVGIDNYILHEDEFLNNAKKIHNKGYTQPTFAKAKESYEFFVKAFEPWLPNN
jgi:hypothetical protein